jgi:hypothetical protein
MHESSPKALVSPQSTKSEKLEEKIENFYLRGNGGSEMIKDHYVQV